MESNKESRFKKYRTTTIYLPKEIREQFVFICKYKKMTVSGFCSKLIKWYLRKNNIAQLMHDYAMEQVEINSKKD